jgi:tetratricopeptide (TPR) repeat protein
MWLRKAIRLESTDACHAADLYQQAADIAQVHFKPSDVHYTGLILRLLDAIRSCNQADMCEREIALSRSLLLQLVHTDTEVKDTSVQSRHKVLLATRLADAYVELEELARAEECYLWALQQLVDPSRTKQGMVQPQMADVSKDRLIASLADASHAKDLAATMNSLAHVYAVTKRLQNASNLWQRAFYVLDAGVKDAGRMQVDIVTQLVQMYMYTDDLKQAEQWQQRGIRVVNEQYQVRPWWKRMPLDEQAEWRYVQVALLHNQSMLLQAQGRQEEAQQARMMARQAVDPVLLGRERTIELNELLKVD